MKSLAVIGQLSSGSLWGDGVSVQADGDFGQMAGVCHNGMVFDWKHPRTINLQPRKEAMMAKTPFLPKVIRSSSSGTTG